MTKPLKQGLRLEQDEGVLWCLRWNKVTKSYQERQRSRVLDIAEAGFGFLRFNNWHPRKGYLCHRLRLEGSVSEQETRSLYLEASNQGEEIRSTPICEREVNGETPISARRRPRYDRLTPIFPEWEESSSKTWASSWLWNHGFSCTYRQRGLV